MQAKVFAFADKPLLTTVQTTENEAVSIGSTCMWVHNHLAVFECGNWMFTGSNTECCGNSIMLERQLISAGHISNSMVFLKLKERSVLKNWLKI